MVYRDCHGRDVCVAVVSRVASSSALLFGRMSCEGDGVVVSTCEGTSRLIS